MSEDHLAAGMQTLDAVGRAAFQVMGHGLGTALAARGAKVVSYLVAAAGVDPRTPDLVTRSWHQGVRSVFQATSAMDTAIKAERERLHRVRLWRAVAPELAGGRGHLYDLTSDGDPLARVGSEYSSAPLKLPDPDEITMGIAIQPTHTQVCYMAVAFNLVAQAWPDVFDGIAEQHGETVAIEVAAGRYETRATLPFTWDTADPDHVTSPDGSNLMAYLEKVAAAHFGSYGALELGNVGEVMTWLAGDRIPPSREQNITELSAEQLQEIIDVGLPVSVGVPRWTGPGAHPEQSLVDGAEISTGHAYAVPSLRVSGNVLKDPEGRRDSKPLTIDELRQLSAVIFWLSPTGTPAIDHDVGRAREPDVI